MSEKTVLSKELHRDSNLSPSPNGPVVPVPISLDSIPVPLPRLVNTQLKFNNMFINIGIHTLKSRKTQSKKCKTIVVQAVTETP